MTDHGRDPSGYTAPKRISLEQHRKHASGPAHRERSGRPLRKHPSALRSGGRKHPSGPSTKLTQIYL